MVNADQYDAASIAPSISSINSLASLLKEKMQVSFGAIINLFDIDVDFFDLKALPSMIRKRKKPKDYKLRAFVAFLFLVIVFLVSFFVAFITQFRHEGINFSTLRSATLILCTTIKSSRSFIMKTSSSKPRIGCCTCLTLREITF